MKRTINILIMITTIFAMLIGAYWLGTAQAKTTTVIKTVDKIIEIVPDGYIDTSTQEFINNYIDMNKVMDFETTENGLYLYLDNGSGYYWER